MTNNRSPAFTLIEMIVVMGVIAIMMSFAYPMYTRCYSAQKQQKT